MNETHDPDDELDQIVDKGVDDAAKAIKEREIPEYDGVQGEPDEWVPEWAVRYFEGYRDRLLYDREFEVSEILKYIEQYRKEYFREDHNDSGQDIEGYYSEEHTDIISVPYFKCPETYPNRQYVDKHCFHDEVGFLTWLKWCVDQGEEKGLEELGGGFAVSGLKRSIQIDKQRKSHSETLSFKLDSERADWVKKAKSLLSTDKKNIYKGAGKCPVSRCASEKIARDLSKIYNYTDLNKAADRIRKYFEAYPSTLEK